jgi:hypothetical protein
VLGNLTRTTTLFTGILDPTWSDRHSLLQVLQPSLLRPTILYCGGRSDPDQRFLPSFFNQGLDISRGTLAHYNLFRLAHRAYKPFV